MGYRAHLCQVTDLQADRLRVDPGLTRPLMDAKPWNPTRRGAETQLSLFGLPPRPSPRIWHAHLEKSWDDLHRMLNAGQPRGGVLSVAVLGSEPLGPPTEADFSLVSRAEVRTIAGVLTRLDREELRRRFERIRIEEEPVQFHEPKNPGSRFATLYRHFTRLRGIYRDAARCDNALLIAIL